MVRVWDLDLKTIFERALPVPSVHYSNAKVVLLGESGAGKSGLALALTGQSFVPTVSTHGRKVLLLDSQQVDMGEGRNMTRETLLWDLAGQPGYRLIHQLHLNEVAVALVIFDARSETDPFAGVYHWHHALEQAQRVQNTTAPPVRKLLVAARMDRGGIGVSRDRINELLKELQFDGYFETSAKEGWGIAELKQAILAAIPWQQLPQVSSTRLFQHIKDFLLAEKEEGRLQPTSEDLYHAFLRSKDAPKNVADLRAQFETCIGRVESRGLIRQLSFGKLVLLQPEKLDAYASALVNAVKEEPDGLGSIAEEDVLLGHFTMPQDERIGDREEEKVLLIAMVEDLLLHEIALREHADDGPHLVFPSQSTRENPDLLDPEGKAAIFTFEGPVLNIYATLIVRLSHSGIFKKKALWKNAATYTTKAGGTCGLFLRNTGEGWGELTLFFEGTSEESSYHFDEYVEAHLMRRALPGTVKRRRIFICSVCGFIVPEQAIQLRRKRGLVWLDCLGCDTRILLHDKEERLAATPSSLVQAMDQAADRQRDSEMAESILRGKRTTSDFDVFLCYANADREEIKRIGEQLKRQGILPWLDEWELRPGLPWQRLLEEQIPHIKAAAVFVGKNGLGPWQYQELDAFLREFVRRNCPVIPVLLANAPQEPALPVFLKGMTWVDFRVQKPDPMQRLLWGITGRQEASETLLAGE